MSKKYGLVGFALLFASLTAEAALPPLYESTREIRAVLEDAKVLELFTAARAIRAIERTSSGYDVHSEDCVLHVGLEYLPSDGVMGPVKFKLNVPDALRCTETKP